MAFALKVPPIQTFDLNKSLQLKLNKQNIIKYSKIGKEKID